MQDKCFWYSRIFLRLHGIQCLRKTSRRCLWLVLHRIYQIQCRRTVMALQKEVVSLFLPPVFFYCACLYSYKLFVYALPGLLEGAKRAPTPDHLDDLYDLDLYTAEETKSLTDQVSDGKSVKSSQSSDGQNDACGTDLWTDEMGLSSDLEEEAQLSLAIQYSMESSNCLLKDDEEQLKKALELSKQLIQDEQTSSITDKTPLLEQQKKKNVDISLEDSIKAANIVELSVFAGYSCDLIRVDIAFGKKVSQRQVEEKLEHRNIRQMTDYHHKCLDMIKRKHAVEIQIQGTIVAVSGFKDYVTSAMCDVKLLVEKISNSVSDKEILKTVHWVRHDPASSDTVPYSDDASVFIENAWRLKLKKVDILLDNQPHIINFDKMQEYNMASGKSVKISRKLNELGDVTQDVPGKWKFLELLDSLWSH